MDFSSIVKITSESDLNFFATGFWLRHSNGIGVLTCKHVLDHGDISKIRINGLPATLLGSSNDAAMDIILLDADCPSKPPLSATTRPTEVDNRCKIHCYGHFDAKVVRLGELTGRVTNTAFREARQAEGRVAMLTVSLDQGQMAGPGSSGGAVLDVQTGQVIGILTHGVSSSEVSILSIEALSGLDIKSFPTFPKVWGKAPIARISIDPWLQQLIEDNNVHDEWLVSDPHKRNLAFAHCVPFLAGHLKYGRVEIFSEKYEIDAAISATEEFLALLFASFLVGSRKDNRCRWFIKQSCKREEDADVSFVKQIWSAALLSGRRDAQLETVNWVILQIIEEAQGKNNNLLFRSVSLLYEVLDPTSHVRVIIDRLKEHDSTLGEDTKPAYLTSLKTLIGRGIGKLVKYSDQPLTFNPKLRTIPSGILCDYEFQAMESHLTEENIYALCGVEAENFTHPYTFTRALKSPSKFFTQLSSEIQTILEMCNDRLFDKKYRWDIPFLTEWLTLAGCDVRDRPFPWGESLPVAGQANIKFDLQQSSKLRPVNSFPKGNSPHGIFDCCGNAHDIVQIHKTQIFPCDFRLAGGCYRTPLRNASCHRIRPFTKRDNETRRNVGLRLVLVEKATMSKRLNCMERFMGSDHPAVWSL